MALQVWLPLNGDLHNQGLTNVIVANNGTTVDNNGKIGKCYSFDNNASFISISHNNLYSILNGNSQPMSICFWVYHADSTRAIIFGDYSVTGGKNFNIELTADHKVRWYWGSPDLSISDMNVGLNTWTHVVFTYSGTVLKGYINGIKKYSTAVTLDAKNRTSGVYQLGRDGRTGNTTLNGKLNDFRIYDHCLSEQEVKEIAQGLILHYPLNNNGVGNENILTNSMFSNLSTSGNVIKDTTKLFNGIFTCKISKTGATSNTYLGWTSQNLVSQLTPGEKITVSVWAYRESNHGIDAGCEWRMYQEYRDNGTKKTDWTGFYNSSSWTIGQWIRFSHTYTIRENITGVYLNLNVIKNGTYWIAQPKVERGSLVTNWCPSSSELNLPTNIIYDTSGYGYNGTITGTLTTITPSPQYNCAAQFNGNNVAIVAGRGPMVKDAISVCCWGYMNDWSSYNSRLLSCTEGGGWNFEPSSGKMNFAMGTGTSSNTYKSVVSNTTLASLNSGWHHFVGTYDGFSTKIYIDGQLDNTFIAYSTKTPIYYHTSNGIFIGAEAGSSATTPGGNYFNGKISDVRIYATALSEADVKALYHNSMIVNGATKIPRDLE